TPAVARRSYVHPAVLEAYLDGTIEPRRTTSSPTGPPSRSIAGSGDEAAVLRLLRRPLARDARRSAAGSR
ncbi:MAG TPA: hypothetical protein VIU37_13630, partial [Candidatus Limnocylindrales bacterium]